MQIEKQRNQNVITIKRKETKRSNVQRNLEEKERSIERR